MDRISIIVFVIHNFLKCAIVSSKTQNGVKLLYDGIETIKSCPLTIFRKIIFCYDRFSLSNLVSSKTKNMLADVD